MSYVQVLLGAIITTPEKNNENGRYKATSAFLIDQPSSSFLGVVRHDAIQISLIVLDCRRMKGTSARDAEDSLEGIPQTEAL